MLFRKRQGPPAGSCAPGVVLVGYNAYFVATTHELSASRKEAQTEHVNDYR